MQRQQLGILLFLVVCNSAQAEEASFAGAWSGFEDLILFQSGSKVCGFWHQIATGREYEGRLIAKAQGNLLDFEFVCGTPGGRAIKFCPQSAADSEDVGWNKSSEAAILCGERLHLKDREKLPNSCSSIPKRWNITALKKANGRQYINDLGDDLDEKRWLHACLNDG